jgi:SAM-dependent methyltransferase
MNGLVHYSCCPVCASESIKNIFQANDHTVSRSLFPVAECAQCTLRFTQDVPDAAAMIPYYKAAAYISHTNTSKGLINRLYQIVRKRTLVKKRKLVQEYSGLKKGRLLDVGSGTGAFVAEMKKNGWEVTGLEPDEDARKMARKVFHLDLDDTATFYQMAPGSFDVITLWHVLEHVHDLSAYVEQLKNLLDKNGKLLVAVPNYTALDASIYQEDWAAYDVPRHLYHFSPASMKWLMEAHGLRIHSYLPMWYDSFYISLLSSKNKDGRTRWISALINGLRSNLKAMSDPKKCSSVIYVIERNSEF